MFCWMMAVEDGLAVVATSRMVSAISGSIISHVNTTSSGGLNMTAAWPARIIIKSSSKKLATLRSPTVPEGETVKSTEIVALKGGGGGEGGGQGGEGGEGGEGGCVGGDGGGDGDGGGQLLSKPQLEP